MAVIDCFFAEETVSGDLPRSLGAILSPKRQRLSSGSAVSSSRVVTVLVIVKMVDSMKCVPLFYCCVCSPRLILLKRVGSFREGQLEAVNAVMSGSDCVLVMPTGVSERERAVLLLLLYYYYSLYVFREVNLFASKYQH